jgi:enamine deaminase RidA (YjgF/YER057c/UK114 family)
MSHLKYTDGTDAGAKFGTMCHYSQAVVLPSGIVKLSGQGGWDASGSLSSESKDGKEAAKEDKFLDVPTQIDNALVNVDDILRAAGCTNGWRDVYLVRSYHIKLDSDSFSTMVAKVKEKYGDDHRPIWTCLGVDKLAIEGMKVEIEVEAILPSAASASA